MKIIKFQKKRENAFLKCGPLEAISKLYKSSQNYESRCLKRLDPVKEKFIMGLSLAWVDDFNCYELALLNANIYYGDTRDFIGTVVLHRSNNSRLLKRKFREWEKYIRSNNYPEKIKIYDSLEFDKTRFIKKRDNK